MNLGLKLYKLNPQFVWVECIPVMFNTTVDTHLLTRSSASCEHALLIEWYVLNVASKVATVFACSDKWAISWVWVLM